MKQRIVCKLEKELGQKINPRRTREPKKDEQEKNFWKIIPFEIQEDGRGELIVYCEYPQHMGIIGNGKARKCFEWDCRYAKIFRPTGYHH